jgi:hypothetical protein
MAVPFGLSAGDFVASLHLLNMAITALCDSDGANSHFQDIVLEIESLVFTFQKVQSLLPTDTPSDILAKLHFIGHQCHMRIDVFLNKIRRLLSELGGQGYAKAQTPFQRYARKPFRQVQWGIHLKKHLSELKSAIAPQLTAIEILLQLLNM